MMILEPAGDSAVAGVVLSAVSQITENLTYLKADAARFIPDASIAGYLVAKVFSWSYGAFENGEMSWIKDYWLL